MKIAKKNGLCSLVASLLVTSLTCGSPYAFSEQLEPEEQKIVVTGTRMKKIDINNLSPILSISSEDVDKLGYATVKDVIDGLTQNSGGTLDNSFTFGFTPGASSVNLRGIGFGHTLVLIDGRRLPIYPIGIGGTNNFVDLSSIPVAFVERVDVLTDGASAVYGSDAVSGVINVITRKNIEGITLSYRTGDTSEGGFGSHRFNLLTGARNGDTQIDLIFDYWSQKALWATQRDYSSSDIANSRGQYSSGGSSFYGLDTGNVYQDPNCGTVDDALAGDGIPNVDVNLFGQAETWCGFDRSGYRQLIAPQERASLMTRLSYEISSDLSFFSRIGYSRTQTNTQLEPVFYGGSLFDGYGFLIDNNGAVLPAGAVNNPTTGTSVEEQGVFIRRLVEFGPRKTNIINQSYNFLAGLKGSIANGQYDWELGIAFNKTALDTASNNILLSGLHAVVDDGLDLFQPIPAEYVDLLSYEAARNSFSSNRVIDFSIVGDLDAGFDSGPVQFAFAIEQVTEKYEDVPDIFVTRGDSFDGSSSGAGDRKHLGIGAELSFPFSDNFNMDIALRWDDYDDDSSVGSAFSPKLAMGYRPTKNILTRFSWGKSFRAPDMQRLFGGPTEGFTNISDPDFQVDSDGNFCPDPANDPDCRASFIESARVYTLANIDLEEEKGSNMNLGVVWEVNNDFSMSLDYFKIDMDNVVAAPSAQSIVNICAEFDLLCELVIRDSGGTLTSGDSFIATFSFNLAEQNTSGLDYTANYQWQNTLGIFSSSLNTTWIRNFETKVTADSQAVDGINLGELPEFKTNITLDWQKDQWGATLRMNYVDEMGGFYCIDCNSDDLIGSWTTFNINTRYHYSDFTRIHFGINNITNKAPPQDPTQTTWPWYPNAGGFYSPVGRELYLQLQTSL
jgi:iron complex outermembrane recepter protein